MFVVLNVHLLVYVCILEYVVVLLQEQTDQQKELDDDEDRKNPAFIPRRGAFYEHDTRMGAQEKEMEEQWLVV